MKLVRQRDLLDLLVIDRTTTDELGRVEVLWMHPPAHRVLGFICKAGPFGGQKLAFNLKQVHQLGAESVVTQGEAVATNVSEVKLLETLIGLEVWSDGGTKMGKIIDCLFNLKSGVITQYLFRSDGWRGVTGGVYQLPTGSIQRFGKKRVFVSRTVMKQPQVYQEGLEEKLAKASDRIKARYTDLTQQASDQLQQVTDQATHQMQSLTDRAAQQLQSLGQQVTEETQALTQSAKQRSQSLLTQAQEQVKHLGAEWVEPSDAETQQSSFASSADIESLDQDWPEDDEWNSSLEDIPPEDLEDDEPWI